MVTIRKPGGLFVATAAVCAVLLSATTVEQVEANPVDAVATSLRGGRRALISTDRSYYSEPINSRRLESEDNEGEDNEGEDNEEEDNEGEDNEGEDNEEQEEEDEKEEEQQQQYQEGNNDDQEEDQNDDAEQEQQEEEDNVENEDNAESDGNMDDDGNANDDQTNIVSSVQDTVTNVQSKFQNVMDRFDEDVINMWSMSPSEWNGECWKIFGAIGGVFTLVLSCLFYLCCLCCSGDKGDNKEDGLLATKADADKRSVRGHRGRIFTRSQTGDSGTVGSQHTGGSSVGEYERPFVLIEDVENDDADNKSAAGMNIADLSSPVYVARNESGGIDDILSPVSSKTESKMNDSSTLSFPSPTSKGAEPVMSIDDADTQASKSSYKSSKSCTSTKTPKDSSGGIISETVEVWSEFLGFRKSKYSLKPGIVSHEEDDDVNLTEDERSRRKTRRSRVSSSPKKSRKSASFPNQMKTGTYSHPKPESDVAITDPIIVSDDVILLSPTPDNINTDKNEKLLSQTPVMSNMGANTNQSMLVNTNQSRSTKLNSPRRTALIKTKNLLRSFGGNVNKSKSKSNNSSRNGRVNNIVDPKEESLLSTEQSATV